MAPLAMALILIPFEETWSCLSNPPCNPGPSLSGVLSTSSGPFLLGEVTEPELQIRALDQAECALVQGPISPSKASVPQLHLAVSGLLDKLFPVSKWR